MCKKIDRKRINAAVRSYADHYDPEDVKVRLKIDHTYRVASFAERISNSRSFSAEQVDFAWLSGMMHDIGRFEQLKRYGTFIDRKSVDHAELGADILFHDGLIRDFVDQKTESDQLIMLEKVIRLHNKLTIPDDLDIKTRDFANILRDADKCDIFRVLTEPPFDTRNERISATKEPARDNVMECVRKHRCVPREEELTAFEGLISQCCMAFELVFPESRRIVKEQGYLHTLMSIDLQPGPREQMNELKRELALE